MKIFLITVIFTFLSAVSSSANNTTAIDQPVTSIVVKKSDRKMYLFSGEKVLRRYRIGLGFSPKGDKKFEGDGKTPEGKYYIDRKNPNSQYYLSLGISYPNESDKKEAAKLGKLPGGDIFIHGRDKSPKWWKRDWEQRWGRSERKCHSDTRYRYLSIDRTSDYLQADSARKGFNWK